MTCHGFIRWKILHSSTESDHTSAHRSRDVVVVMFSLSSALRTVSNFIL
jgi:hypothetical protein